MKPIINTPARLRAARGVRRTLRTSFVAFATCASFTLLATSPLRAITPLPQNLGPGLDILVSSRVEYKNSIAAQSTPPKAGETRRPGAGAPVFYSTGGVAFSSQRAADIADSAIGDEQGRVMVMVRLNGLATFEEVSRKLQANAPSFTVTATDKNYKAGVLEGYVNVDDVARLATARGVSNVLLEYAPELNRSRVEVAPAPQVVVGQALTLLGTTFDQGVTQHRIDTINKYYNPSATLDYQGSGISIGAMSDSYAKSTSTITAAIDVANFDLPGASGNPVNTTPVTVLQDKTSTGTDEGRGMMQNIYKMAPKAALAFASASNGEVLFANNIRALAGLSGFTYPSQTFVADVICDDVGYSDEPFFEDGLVGNAVDDVAAAGVAYFSSAGNDIGTYDYDSDFRYVPNGTGLTAATNTALAGTNINLTNVPTNLYQGGFHNFSPNAGQQDVALLYNLNIPASQFGTAYITNLPATNLQWDDPFSQTTVTTGLLSTQAGNIAANSGASQTFSTPSLTAGTYYSIQETADSGSTFDGIITVTDPNGNFIVQNQDTDTDEAVNFYAPVTGVYTVTVKAFSTTGGAYHVNVYTAVPSPVVTTDFNLLTFDKSGNYLAGSSLTANNISSNIPQEYGKTAPSGATQTSAGEGQVQYVLARSSVPTSPTPATHFRILVRGNGLQGIGPAEYFTYNTPNIKGHAMARGCNGTAAFSVFRPNVPEYFTSPGPATVYFDKFSNRLATPEVRLQPNIGATDNANTSFFPTGGDSAADLDSSPNFSGTSSASPHAAAIAGLVLQAHGGRGSVTPTQMKTLLQNNTFPHDLDPNSASGVARSSNGGKITLTVNSDLGLNPSAGAFNPNSINVSYVGPGTLETLVFNPQGTAATAGSTSGGNNGVDTSNPPVYFDNLFPGIVFQPNTIPFTIGSGSTVPAGTTAAFSNQAPAPSVAGQWWTMTLTFPTGTFTGGKVFRFTVGHGPQHNSQVSNGTGATGGVTSTSFTQADLFGQTVRLPQGDFGNGSTGMTFSGTTSGGGTFSGTLSNRIGAGWSKTEGYGFINAQAAVQATLP